MKRLTFFMFALLVAAALSAEEFWCEQLVNMLIKTQGIDKTVAVNRDASSHDITNATYDFRFSSKDIYNVVESKIINNTATSEFYSESGEKSDKVYLIRTINNGRRWSCKLWRLGKNGNQFLVRVSLDNETDEPVIFTKKRSSRTATKNHIHSINNPSTADKEAAIDALDEQLRLAAEARKRKLAR